MPRPSAVPGTIRDLTQAEIDTLEQALSAPVDRKYLVHWVKQSIEDAVRLAVKLASAPTPRQVRDDLLRIERDGREWLESIANGKGTSLLSTRVDVTEFQATVGRFCDRVAALAGVVDAAVRGPPRTPIGLEVFVERMIGVAKRAKVPPSTPSRRANRKTSTTFLRFLVAALRTARQVIKTSALEENVKKLALSKLQHESQDALIEMVVKKRGRIGDYRDSHFGLTEW